jgi:hypothetical protein
VREHLGSIPSNLWLNDASQQAARRRITSASPRRLATRRLPPQICSRTTAAERVATDVEEKFRADGKLLYEKFFVFHGK